MPRPRKSRFCRRFDGDVQCGTDSEEDIVEDAFLRLILVRAGAGDLQSVDADRKHVGALERDGRRRFPLLDRLNGCCYAFWKSGHR